MFTQTKEASDDVFLYNTAFNNCFHPTYKHMACTGWRTILLRTIQAEPNKDLQLPSGAMPVLIVCLLPRTNLAPAQLSSWARDSWGKQADVHLSTSRHWWVSGTHEMSNSRRQLQEPFHLPQALLYYPRLIPHLNQNIRTSDSTHTSNGTADASFSFSF